MSQYTTGELAKLCGVTVRTVQYYDNRGILCPSALSEGGRRLYSEEDLQRMKQICFLRELDLPLNSIAQLLSEPEPEKVFSLLLSQQEAILQKEMDDRKERLEQLQQLRRGLGKVKDFSVNSITDIAVQMKNKKNLYKVRGIMLGVGLALEAIEIGTLIYAVNTGNWWWFGAGMVILILGAIWLSAYYFKSVDYICPQCNRVFKPTFKEAFFANHTPNTRKLTCPHCGHKGFCVEIATEEK
ncbi:MAG: MerR family transcriptional regulator [Clostridia bacterium]|nr:MerR family transcriptional regulator [Clostridia bacterium]